MLSPSPHHVPTPPHPPTHPPTPNPTNQFFIAASVFFLFMSAGLMGHASYEFQKAGVFGTWACGHFNGTTYSLDDDASGDTGGYRRLTDMFAHNVGFEEVRGHRYPPAALYQPNHRPPTADGQPKTVNQRPSTNNRQPQVSGYAAGYRLLGSNDEMDESCYSKVTTGDGTDDYFAYRRLGSASSDDDEFFTRTKVRVRRGAEGRVHRGGAQGRGEMRRVADDACYAAHRAATHPAANISPPPRNHLASRASATSTTRLPGSTWKSGT